MENIEEHDNKLDKVLEKIKKMDIEKFDDIKIQINADDKLPDDIALKNGVILIKCVIKDDDKFHPQLFLEEALVV